MKTLKLLATLLGFGVIFFVLMLLVGALSGCAAPSDNRDRAKAKVAAVEKKQGTNDLAQIKSGVAAVSAAQHALEQDKEPTRYSEVAKLTLDRAQMAFSAGGAVPDVREVIALQKMVDGLISTNKELHAAGEKAQKEWEARLVRTEARADSLAADKDVLVAKLEVVNTENAKLADTWFKIKSFFWWVVWIVGGLMVLRLVCAIIPPPYNSVGFILDYIAGGFGRMVVKVLPHSAEAAGVVPEKAFAAVVKGVGEFRNEVKMAAAANGTTSLKWDEIQETLDGHMKDATEVGTANFKPLIEKFRAKANV